MTIFGKVQEANMTENVISIGAAESVPDIEDDVTDLTWLADANYAQTSGYDTDGIMSWDDANAWAVSLNISGVTGWRLPKTKPIDGITSNDRNDSHIGT
jgi:hypothetical protein